MQKAVSAPEPTQGDGKYGNMWVPVTPICGGRSAPDRPLVPPQQRFISIRELDSTAPMSVRPPLRNK